MKTVTGLLLLLQLFCVGQGLPPSRIYGGHDVEDGTRYNNMVFVLTGDSTFSDYGLCAGTLVEDRWVLMAAHCFDNRSHAILVAGQTALEDYVNERVTLDPMVHIDEHKYGLQERRAQSIHRHDKYNASQHDHDIALVQLDEPFNLTTSVGVVAISQDKFDMSDTCTILGWGTSSISLNRYRLKAAENVTALPITQCRLRHRGSFVCIEKSNPPKGVCKGDSGSPLLCGGLVRGVASFALNYMECGKDEEEYYLDTEPYLKWMKDTMKVSTASRVSVGVLTTLCSFSVSAFLLSR